MDWTSLHTILVYVQRLISFTGVMIILSGVLLAIVQYVFYFTRCNIVKESEKINSIRLNLGRVLILGLEFIVAADLIGTTTTPDYYAVGLLAIIVVIRTLLSFSLNKELMALSHEK